MRPPFFMEILFAGCSITWGDELKDRLNSRYSKIICDALGANETNIAECGQSNDWIARKVVEETQRKKYDRVYVQLTIPSRLEYFTEDAVNKLSLQYAKDTRRRCHSQARWYYKMVWNRKHGVENMYKNKFIIEKVVDCELIFLFADCCDENSRRGRHLHHQSYWKQFCKIDHYWIWEDILGHRFGKGPLGKSETHPLEDSHKKIADYLLNKDK